MTDFKNQLVLANWLDGPAKLTQKQLDLVKNQQAEQTINSINKQGVSSNNKNKLVAIEDDSNGANKDQHYLEEIDYEWKENEIITMFHEEKVKILQRDKYFKQLLEEVQLILNKISNLNSLCDQLKPAIKLYLDCKGIIKNRRDLLVSLEKTNSLLSKQPIVGGELQTPSDGTILTRVFDFLYTNYL